MKSLQEQFHSLQMQVGGLMSEIDVLRMQDCHSCSSEEDESMPAGTTLRGADKRKDGERAGPWPNKKKKTHGA